jgi:hypothetical protein
MMRGGAMDRRIADRIRLKTRLIVHEGTASQRELARIAADGEYGPLPAPGVACRLECGGKIIATGDIVKKKGKVLFRITRTETEEHDG